MDLPSTLYGQVQCIIRKLVFCGLWNYFYHQPSLYPSISIITNMGYFPFHYLVHCFVYVTAAVGFCDEPYKLFSLKLPEVFRGTAVFYDDNSFLQGIAHNLSHRRFVFVFLFHEVIQTGLHAVSTGHYHVATLQNVIRIRACGL